MVMRVGTSALISTIVSTFITYRQNHALTHFLFRAQMFYISGRFQNLTPMIPLDGEVSVDPEAGYFATSSSPVASSSKSSTDDDVTQSTRSVKEREPESSSRGVIYSLLSKTLANVRFWVAYSKTYSSWCEWSNRDSRNDEMHLNAIIEKKIPRRSNLYVKLLTWPIYRILFGKSRVQVFQSNACFAPKTSCIFWDKELRGSDELFFGETKKKLRRKERVKEISDIGDYHWFLVLVRNAMLVPVPHSLTYSSFFRSCYYRGSAVKECE